MILSDVLDYLAETKRASLLELAQRFDIQPPALQAMLAHGIRKGKLRQEQAANACESRCQQQCTPTVLYCWCE